MQGSSKGISLLVTSKQGSSKGISLLESSRHCLSADISEMEHTICSDANNCTSLFSSSYNTMSSESINSHLL